MAYLQRTLTPPRRPSAEDSVPELSSPTFLEARRRTHRGVDHEAPPGREPAPRRPDRRRGFGTDPLVVLPVLSFTSDRRRVI